MPRLLDIETFIKEYSSEKPLLLDSRSPGEYNHAHIPGAVNLPLLDDEQRATIGITFKQRGREAAILKGFDLVGPHFAGFIRKAKKLNDNRDVFLYCWRGGLRSSIMAWVLGMGGFQVTLLKGGYKNYRQWVLKELDKDRPWLILGGRTGTGKTEILQTLSSLAPVIDLEALACHKGSAFGHLGQPAQPGNEHYENLVAEKLFSLEPGQPVWLENESTNIGAVKIPDNLYKAIKESNVVEIERDLSERRKRILDEYGSFPVSDLAAAMQRIRKRLGEVRMQEALEMLQQGQLEPWCDRMLAYYDTMYAYGIETRRPGTVCTVDVNNLDAGQAARKILQAASAFLKTQPA